jgi:hypothetical protein
MGQGSQTNNQVLIDHNTIESLIDDLLLHKRQDSTDSGLDDGMNIDSKLYSNHISFLSGRCSTNQMNDGLNSTGFPDDLLFPPSSGLYQNPLSLPITNNFPPRLDYDVFPIIYDSRVKVWFYSFLLIHFLLSFFFRISLTITSILGHPIPVFNMQIYIFLRFE